MQIKQDKAGLTDQTDILTALRRADILADVPLEALHQFADAARKRSLSAGELAFHQGEPANIFFVLLSGHIRLVQHTAEGKDVTMATFGPGDVIGLIVALTGEAYRGSAEALEATDLLALPGDLMWRTMNTHAPLAVRVLKMVAARLHEAHDRIRELSVERVQQRIARAILRLTHKGGIKQPDGSIVLDLRMSRQDLAQLTGTTLETVSRTLSGWERDGIIEAGREHITVLKPHALVVVAEDLPR